MNDLSPNVTFACEFAIKAHGDQKYGTHPYVYHLDKVAEIVRPWGDELMIIEHAEFRSAAYRPMICNQIWTALNSLLNHVASSPSGACETP